MALLERLRSTRGMVKRPSRLSPSSARGVITTSSWEAAAARSTSPAPCFRGETGVPSSSSSRALPISMAAARSAAAVLSVTPRCRAAWRATAKAPAALPEAMEVPVSEM